MTKRNSQQSVRFVAVYACADPHARISHTFAFSTVLITERGLATRPRCDLLALGFRAVGSNRGSILTVSSDSIDLLRGDHLFKIKLGTFEKNIEIVDRLLKRGQFKHLIISFEAQRILFQYTVKSAYYENLVL